MTRAPDPFANRPVAGWDAEHVDKDVRETVHDFACWINYLLHPAEHEGPRRYVCGGAEGCGFYLDTVRKFNEAELESFHNLYDAHNNLAEWELRSVLEGVEVSHLFDAIHAFCGMLWSAHSTMGDAFVALTDAEWCTARDRIRGSQLYVHDANFCEFRAAMEVVQGLGKDDPRYATFLYYQRSVVIHAERLENQAFLLAEALGSYRGYFQGYRDRVERLMRRTTEIFDALVQDEWNGPDISGWDIVSAVAGSLIALPFTAVGGAAAVAGATIVGVISSLVAGELTEQAKQAYETENAEWLRAPDSVGIANTAIWREVIDPLIDAFDRYGNELVELIDVNSSKGIAHDVERDLGKIIDETSQGMPIPAAPDGRAIILQSSFKCDGAGNCLYPAKVKEYEDAGIAAGLEPGMN